MSDYVYLDEVRADIYRMIPPDGHVIGSIDCGRAATEAQLVRNSYDFRFVRGGMSTERSISRRCGCSGTF